MTKILYEKPFCQTLVIRFGGVVCGSNTGTVNGGQFATPYADIEDDSEEDWGW